MMIQLIQKFLDYLYSFFLTPSKKQITKFPSKPKKDQKKIPSNTKHGCNFLSAAKTEEERKEMMMKEINGLDNTL